MISSQNFTRQNFTSQHVPAARLGAMASFTLFFSLVLASCVDQSTALSLERSTQRAAIIGGQEDLAHVAVFDILVDGEQSCTGTLVSPHVVLTAAHCIVEDVDDATELMVFTGPNEFDLAGGDLHEVVSGPYHPTYGTNGEVGDIAVLILAEPSDIQPMPYNRRPLSADLVGSSAVIVGYGDTTVVDPTSGGGIRKSATVPIQDLDGNWIIVGDDPGESQCYGDSGGPVLMVINGVEQVVGINSWGETDDCGDPEYNTRVDRFLAFVDDQVQAADPGFEPGDVDAGSAGDDAGIGDDAGTSDDAGTAENDAGTSDNDAGGNENDAGIGDDDAGTSDDDAGSGDDDAGSGGDDAGASEIDAGHDAEACGNDAGTGSEDVGCGASQVQGATMPTSVGCVLLMLALSTTRRRKRS